MWYHKPWQLTQMRGYRPNYRPHRLDAPKKNFESPTKTTSPARLVTFCHRGNLPWTGTYTITKIRQNNHVWHSSGRKEERQTTEVTRRGWVYHLPTPSDCLSSERRHQWCPDGLDDYRIGHHHHHHYHYWAVVVCRGWAGWARASACHLLSCAVLCQIVSLKYLSRSFLHRLLSFLVIMVSKRWHARSIGRLSGGWYFPPLLIMCMTLSDPDVRSLCPCMWCWAYFLPFWSVWIGKIT